MQRFLRIILAMTLMFVGFTVTAPAAAAGPVYGSGCYTTVTHAVWDYRIERRYRAGQWCISDPNSHARLVFQGDGNLVVYNATNIGGVAMWSSRTQFRGSVLKLQTDGNVVIIDSGAHIVWAFGIKIQHSQGTYRLYVSQHVLQTTLNNRQQLQAVYFSGPTQRI